MIDDTRYANVPQELKERRQWVCYRLEKRSDDRTKVPYRTAKAGGGNARSNDPATWHTFEEVLESVSNPKNKFDGIGFMISESDPYVFIDLDHVVNDGVIEEWAVEIINKVDSYTEFSQSGSGIHIIARAKKPGGRCNTHKHPKFEIYEKKRMVVFTGKLCPEIRGEIRDAQDEINDLYFSIFGKNQHDHLQEETIRDFNSIGISDPELIKKAMNAKNGDKFSRLWNGNIVDYNGDDSSADMALCCMLAFWTQRDSERIDKLFRESGLMRDKWDQMRGDRTYGEMTIDVAIKQTKDVYQASSDSPDKHEVTKDELVLARAKIRHAKKMRTAAAVFKAVDSLAILPSGEYADVVKELKDAIPQLDLRELKGAVTKTRKSRRSGDVGKYPVIVVNDRQLRDMGDAAIRQLEASNVPPTLFVRSGTLCQIIEDERGNPAIYTVTEDMLISRLTKICDFVEETRDGLKNVVPPRIIAAYILSQGKWPFPALESITRSPTIKIDGSVAQNTGYDSESLMYYQKPNNDVIVDIPESPTRKDVNESLELIDELLHDFPFDSQASKANAIALLLSLVIQPTARDITPLFLIDAPIAGSGKSLLATVAGIISGDAVPEFTTAPNKDEEWTKKITAMLSSGSLLIVIDNVKYVLQSSVLAALLTARSWKDRILGKNDKTIVLPNRAIWVATGNNIQLSGDIPRRCISIRLDPKLARPHERKDFLHADLILWVFENRELILSALLTICRAWYTAKCPMYPVPAFGSFEKWTNIIGCILAHVGIKGFLENRNDLWEQSDTESDEWEDFLACWKDSYQGTPITPKKLIDDIKEGKEIADMLPSSLSDAVHSNGDNCSRLGYQLKSRLGKRYGLRGLRLEKGPKSRKGKTWLVVEDSPEHVNGSNNDNATHHI